MRYFTATELESRSDPGHIQLFAKSYTLRPNNLNIRVLIAEDRIKYLFDIQRTAPLPPSYRRRRPWQPAAGCCASPHMPEPPPPVKSAAVAAAVSAREKGAGGWGL